MLSIDQVQEMLDRLTDELPQEFFTGLNGGVSLLQQAKISPRSRSGDLFILGEYRRDSMGCYINIYYGSFKHLFGHLPPRLFERELRKTLRHEFTHHVEALAGEDALEQKDEWQLERYRKNHPDDQE